MYKFSIVNMISDLFKIKTKKRLPPILSMDEISSLNLKMFGEITPDIFGEKLHPKKSSPSLLMVDDEESMYFIYKNCFRRIKTFSKDGDDVYHDFHLLPTFGKNSGLVAYRCIEELPKIDYAILDLTLSYTFKIVPGMCKKPEFLHRTIVMDGVDLAIKLHEKNPNVKIRFLTSHTDDFTISTIKPYADKFYAYFKDRIENHYINKESDYKFDQIYNFLYNKHLEEK